MFSRRGFIRVGAAAVGSLALRPFGLLPALAQSSAPDYRALVCVFLFGGNDSNNMVIPMDGPNYQAYLKLRGALALQTADLTNTVTAKTGGAPYAFHGKLTELASLFQNKELAVVANTGPLVQPTTQAQYQAQNTPLPLNLFSHADQQQEWQTDVPGGHSSTGWAGRAADLISPMNSGTLPAFLSVAGNAIFGAGVNTQPVAITPGQSLDLKGFNTSAESKIRKSVLENLLNFDSGISLIQTANSTLANGISDAQALDAALAKASPLQTAFPKTGLGQQLQQVARVVQVRNDLGMRRQIFFASLGGFDTHTNELNTHVQLYAQLSQGLAAFNSAMQELGAQNDVTTFTESDFSRTFQPTSGNGSDHAWGGHHLVLGGAVAGGDIYGEFPAFELGGPDDTDTRGRWIPTISVDQYGATLSSWFGIQDSDLTAVFPNFENFGSRKLGFLG